MPLVRNPAIRGPGIDSVTWSTGARSRDMTRTDARRHQAPASRRSPAARAAVVEQIGPEPPVADAPAPELAGTRGPRSRRSASPARLGKRAAFGGRLALAPP